MPKRNYHWPGLPGHPVVKRKKKVSLSLSPFPTCLSGMICGGGRGRERERTRPDIFPSLCNFFLFIKKKVTVHSVILYVGIYTQEMSGVIFTFCSPALVCLSGRVDTLGGEREGERDDYSPPTMDWFRFFEQKGGGGGESSLKSISTLKVVFSLICLFWGPHTSVSHIIARSRAARLAQTRMIKVHHSTFFFFGVQKKKKKLAS